MNKFAFVHEISSLPKNAMFVAINGYKNELGEVSNFTIGFHISYENMLIKSKNIIEQYEPDDELEIIAKKELIQSFNTSLLKISSTPVEEIEDCYQRFFDCENNYIKGLKMHREKCELYMYGSVVNKKVITPVEYPKKNKRELTIAKDRLKALCPISKFRQYKLTSSNFESLRLCGKEYTEINI